jgi:hypothetical protein
VGESPHGEPPGYLCCFGHYGYSRNPRMGDSQSVAQLRGGVLRADVIALPDTIATQGITVTSVMPFAIVKSWERTIIDTLCIHFLTCSNHMSVNNIISAVGRRITATLPHHMWPNPHWFPGTHPFLPFSHPPQSPPFLLTLCNREAIVQLHLAVHPLTHPTSLSETAVSRDQPHKFIPRLEEGLCGKQRKSHSPPTY